MKNKTNQNSLFSILGFSSLAWTLPLFSDAKLYSAGISGETATLGFVSLGLLFLFYYVVKEMGEDNGVSSPSSLETLKETFQRSKEESNFSYSSDLEGNETSQDIENWEDSKIPFRIRDRIHTITNQTIRSSLSQKEFPLGTTEKLFSLYDSGEFREFLLERGSLVIECDTDSFTEIGDEAKVHLISLRPFFESDRNYYHQPIFSKGQLLGAISTKVSADLSESETKQLEQYAKSLAKRMEEATRYEVGRLDWESGLYNRSHFFKSLEEKYEQNPPLVLHTVLVSSAQNLTGAVSAIGSYLRDSFQPTPEVFRRDKQKISLFLPSGSEEVLVEVLEHFHSEIQKEGIGIAYASVSVKNRDEFATAMDWVKRSEWELRRVMGDEWIPS